MNLKYEPASEPLHISTTSNGPPELPEIHTHALRLRLDGLVRYTLNGRIGLDLYFAEMCADARAVASRVPEAPIERGEGDPDVQWSAFFFFFCITLMPRVE